MKSKELSRLVTSVRLSSVCLLRDVGDELYFLPVRRRRAGHRDKCGAVRHIRRLACVASAAAIYKKTHAALRKEEEEREQDGANIEGIR